MTARSEGQRHKRHELPRAGYAGVPGEGAEQAELKGDLAELRARLREATETIEAIRAGAVDSLVIGLPGQEQVYALTTADRTYRLIVESMSEGTAVVSQRGVIVETNPQLQAMTGRSASGLAGTDALGLASPSSRPALARLLQAGLRGGRDRTEAELNGPGGQPFPVLVAASGFSADAASLCCLVLSDLTAQRAAQDEASAAAAYNRSLIEASLDPLVTIAPDGILTDVNVATERATGYSHEELAGTDFSSYFTDPAAARAGYEQAFRKEAIRDYPLGLRHRDGHVAPVLYNAAVYRDPDGQVAGVFATARDMTAVRKAEAALQDAEASYRALFEQPIVGMSEMTPGGSLIRANAAYSALTGYSPGELRSMSMANILHPDDMAADIDHSRRMLAGEMGSYSLVRRYRRKDRSTGWIDVTHTIVRDEDGKPLRVIAVGRDITEQRRTEQALHTSEERLRAIVHDAPIGITELTTDGAFVSANAYMCDLLGYRPDEIRGLAMADVTNPEDLAADAAQLERLTSGAIQSYAMTKRYRRKDGGIVWVAVSRSVVHDGDGCPIRIVSVVQDINAQRQAEDSLRRSEARLQALVDNAPVGIAETLPDGRFKRANPAYCQLTGYTEDELREIGGLAEITDPADRPADEAQIRQLFAGEISAYTIDKRYLRKDGTTVWVTAARALVRDARGEPERLISVVRDITGQRQAEAEVRELNTGLERRVKQRTADLELANRNLQSFTYSVSHDLRAPLRALSGFSEALEEDFGDKLGETGRGYTQRIEAASQRMAQLIDDLLLLSRVSRAGIDPQPVDLSAQARTIAGQLRGSDPARQVRFDIADGVTVTADRELIRSVLQNLLENAWKFTSRTADPVIEFGAAPAPEGQTCCYVRDNGAGFDPAYVDRLFQPFQRLHHERDYPGTGIGLASVARIIERHGGRTWAEGAVDQGATFYFTLSGTPEPAPPGQAALPAPPPGQADG